MKVKDLLEAKSFIAQFEDGLRRYAENGFLPLQHWTTLANYKKIKKEGFKASPLEVGYGTCFTIGKERCELWNDGNDVLIYVNLPVSELSEVIPDPNVSDYGHSKKSDRELMAKEFLGGKRTYNRNAYTDQEVIVELETIPPEWIVKVEVEDA